MKSITLNRMISYPKETLGYILLSSGVRLQTLENTKKLFPVGTYPLTFTYSPKFKCEMPLIVVPKRSGIRFHSGNTYRDSSGCVLVGLQQSNRCLLQSREAFKILVTYLKGHEIDTLRVI